MTTKMILNSNNHSNNSSSLPPQSNFDSIGLRAVDGEEPSASSSNSSGCANFPSQAHHQNYSSSHQDEALKKLLHRVGDGDEFENFEVSSHFSDIACGAHDGVAADEMEQLCNELFTVEEAAVATLAANNASNNQGTHEVQQSTVDLMAPVTHIRKASEAEGGSTASSLPSGGSQGHHIVTDAEGTSGSDNSPYPYALKEEELHNTNVGIPEVYNQYPPQGHGNSINQKNVVSVPNMIVFPQSIAQKNVYPTMTNPCAPTASTPFLEPQAFQFCYPQTQFSSGAVTSGICPQPSKHTCAKCHHPGSDIKIKHCPNGCTYHARCLDLISLCNQKQESNVNNVYNATTETLNPVSLSRGLTPPTSMALLNNGVTNGDDSSGGMLSYCPSCLSFGATGIEILPLDFDELDLVQQKVAEETAAKKMSSQFSKQRVPPEVAAAIGSAIRSGMKRPHDEIMSSAPVSSVTPSSESKCYDPNVPRTGRWTQDEIAFRDALVALFLAGNLPLSNGLKLNDFLHNMLKSKQSRLAKKMKNAKLSTKYFFPKSGFVDDKSNEQPSSGGATKSFTAEEFSMLEMKFISSLQDPIERSEMIFHMKKEWRDHFAQRCHYLRVDFDGSAWLSSIDEMERRLASEKNRIKAAKRRLLMGKAMETDTSTSSRMPGVFVDATDTAQDDFDSIVARTVLNTSNSQNSMHMELMSKDSQAISHGFGEHNSSVTGASGSKKAEKESSISLNSISNDPNFKHAAPFLSGVATYIETNSIPFEHIDVWVPSYVEGTSSMGTGTNTPSNNTRLVYGGSATMGVQIVDNEPTTDGTTQKTASAMKRVALTDDDKTNFSMFGTYSEKFSFDAGCGLPGRVYQSGVPAWEQFVSEAHASSFERRGGAVQFGVKTAVALPVESPSVGRIVLILYSKYDRKQSANMLGRLMNDIKLLNPAPRWKLVVDCGSKGLHPSSLHEAPSAVPSNQAAANVSMEDTQESKKKKQTNELIFLLGEQIPLDMNSALGEQIHSIMSLRLVLLRPSRTPEEEALVNTILVLYESYLQAGRPSQDIACMLARDFCFHLQHVQQQMVMSYTQGMH